MLKADATVRTTESCPTLQNVLLAAFQKSPHANKINLQCPLQYHAFRLFCLGNQLHGGITSLSTYCAFAGIITQVLIRQKIMKTLLIEDSKNLDFFDSVNRYIKDGVGGLLTCQDVQQNILPSVDYEHLLDQDYCLVLTDQPQQDVNTHNLVKDGVLSTYKKHVPSKNLYWQLQPFSGVNTVRAHFKSVFWEMLSLNSPLVTAVVLCLSHTPYAQLNP